MACTVIYVILGALYLVTRIQLFIDLNKEVPDGEPYVAKSPVVISNTMQGAIPAKQVFSAK